MEIVYVHVLGCRSRASPKLGHASHCTIDYIAEHYIVLEHASYTMNSQKMVTLILCFNKHWPTWRPVHKPLSIEWEPVFTITTKMKKEELIIQSVVKFIKNMLPAFFPERIVLIMY